MAVILKQRTCVNADGMAVPDGHPDSIRLIGPEGATVTDEQAKSLKLVDGALPDYEKMEEDRIANEERRAKDAAVKEAAKTENKSINPKSKRG